MPEERERFRDYDDRDEIDERLAKIVSRVVRDADVGISYGESGSGLLKWILGVLSALLVAVIVGGITTYGRFTSLETRVTEWQKSTERRLDALEARRP
jgi:hypothetical protein